MQAVGLHGSDCPGQLDPSTLVLSWLDLLFLAAYDWLSDFLYKAGVAVENRQISRPAFSARFQAVWVLSLV
jgi:hypothetical protein